ncbi:MAG: phage BR0599 family protein [Acidithiobacillus sp.]|uniref:phage BR0599 family protein n=1 Tax=Acidithiobacillus sp. TaxID=1872118 RepID=UPI00258EF687|nr:phage BR0599 family protein [Acidithiobacillus sp.]MCE5420249.1 phage BR0599 family protein [Acidithiobacillus sp.]
MSYPARENSVSSAQPVELYRFAFGPRRWTYTSGQSEVQYQSESYVPVSIKRSNIEQGNDINRAGLAITLPRDHPLADLYLASPPEGVVSVTIYRFHVGDAETIVWWKGRVGGISFSGAELLLKCEPVASSLKRHGLRAHYQLLCRHALYSDGCGARKEAYRVDGSVAAVQGVYVQVAAAAGRPDGYFVCGMLQTNEGSRMIVHHQGIHLTLVAPMPSLAAGKVLRLYAGCDHALATCKDRFANLANYGGFPFIPTKNPFTGDAIV